MKSFIISIFVLFYILITVNTKSSLKCCFYEGWFGNKIKQIITNDKFEGVITFNEEECIKRNKAEVRECD